jgi:hypothetical protein
MAGRAVACPAEALPHLSRCLLFPLPLLVFAAYALGFLNCDDISARCMLSIFQFFATKTDASALRMLNGSPAERLLKPIADYITAKGGRIHTRWGCRCARLCAALLAGCCGAHAGSCLLTHACQHPPRTSLLPHHTSLCAFRTRHSALFLTRALHPPHTLACILLTLSLCAVLTCLAAPSSHVTLHSPVTRITLLTPLLPAGRSSTSRAPAARPE